MADVKISDLTETTTLADNDLLEIERASDGAPRKIKKSNARKELGGNWWFKPPQSSIFTAANTDGANLVMVDDADAGLCIDLGTQPTGTGDKMRRITTPTPSASANWRCIMKRKGWLHNGIDYHGMGLCVVDTASSRLTVFGGPNKNNTGARMAGDNWNSFGSSYSGAIGTSRLTSDWPDWLRVDYDHAAGTFSYYYSTNGKTWRLWATVTKASFLTNGGDRVGFAYGTNNSTGQSDMQCTIEHWTLETF